MNKAFDELNRIVEEYDQKIKGCRLHVGEGKEPVLCVSVAEYACAMWKYDAVMHCIAEFGEQEGIAHLIRKSLDGSEVVSFYKNAGKEEVLSRVIPTLCAKPRNEGIVTQPFGKLYVVYRIYYEESSTQLTYALCKHLGLSIDEVVNAANENLQKLPTEITSMQDLLSGMEVPNELYVVRKLEQHGAHVLLSKGDLAQVAERLQDDLLILPSSVHEVIVLRKSQCDSPEELLSMVMEVNRTCVSEDDFLADNVFCYTREGSKLYDLTGVEYSYL